MRRKPSVLDLDLVRGVLGCCHGALVTDHQRPMPLEVLASPRARAGTLQDIELTAARRTLPRSGLAGLVSSAWACAEDAEGSRSWSGVEPGRVQSTASAASAATAFRQGRPNRSAGRIVRPANLRRALSASRARRASRVIIEATIDPRKAIRHAAIHSALDQAALDAVRQWKFTPTLLNGIAVPVIMTVTVNFELSQ
jgi:TonB family protein